MDQRITAYVGTMTAQALGLKGVQGTDEVLNIATPDNANVAIGTLDSALKSVNKQRADLGAYQNRLEETSYGLGIAAENLQSAESTIRDADMASEMVDFTKNQILTQSGVAMLAQANNQSQNVLALLR
jgi:flagellin